MTLQVSVIHDGRKSETCRAFQAAMNRRLRARGLDALTVKEDGVCGPATLKAARTAAFVLGAQQATYNGIVSRGAISVGVQRMVRNPGRRTDGQLALGKARWSQIKAARDRRAKAASKERSATGGSSRSRAVNAFLAKVGTVERPPGSNGGPLISDMQAYWGFGRVPWCGIAVGYFAKVYGGMQGLRSDVASVAAIENHARAGHFPYGRWVNDISGLLPGAFLVIGGRGVHVEMLVDVLPGGAAITAGGNTSFGPGGSQSNGGAIARRSRSNAEIRGGASMQYPPYKS